MGWATYFLGNAPNFLWNKNLREGKALVFGGGGVLKRAQGEGHNRSLMGERETEVNANANANVNINADIHVNRICKYKDRTQTVMSLAIVSYDQSLARRVNGLYGLWGLGRKILLWVLFHRFGTAETTNQVGKEHGRVVCGSCEWLSFVNAR